MINHPFPRAPRIAPQELQGVSLQLLVVDTPCPSLSCTGWWPPGHGFTAFYDALHELMIFDALSDLPVGIHVVFYHIYDML